MLNEFQKIVAQHYGCGDFAHVSSMDDVRECGDTLFHFIMVELSGDEGCENIEHAIRRMEMARKDVSGVLRQLQNRLGQSYG